MQTNQIAFCWSGEKVFVTTGEGKTRILSYPDFEPVLRLDYLVDQEDGKGREYTLAGHTSSCVTAELQPTGRYLATGGTDSIIALWDTTDWICKRTLSKMTGPVRSISRALLLIYCLQLNDALTETLGFTFDGSFIAGGSDEGVSLSIALCSFHILFHLCRGDSTAFLPTGGILSGLRK